MTKQSNTEEKKLAKKDVQKKALSSQNNATKGMEAELLAQLSVEDRKKAENLLKEMQEEISPEATPLWQFVNDNAPKIAVTVIGLVLIIAGFAFYHGFQETAFEEARIELATIISNPQEAQRLKALEAFQKNAPQGLQVGINYEMARAAFLAGDIKKAEECFLAVVQEEGKSALGVTASLNLADMYAKANEAQKALAIYEDIITAVPEDLRLPLYVNMADIAVAAHQNEKAISTFQKILDTISQNEGASEDIEYFKSRIQELS